MRGGDVGLGDGARRLVGRVREKELLEQVLLDRPRDEVTRVIEVVGEPGIGKSRLLGEMRAGACRQGWMVLAGHATELERHNSFGVFLDAMGDHVASLDPHDLAGLGTELVGELAMVFPGILVPRDSAEATHERLALGVERYRLHLAICALLGRLASPLGLVLTLDDLHWGDVASFELLGYLLRHPPRVPVVLVLAYRPGQRPGRLAAVLTQAMREGMVRRIELGPLSLDEVAEFLGPDVDRVRCRVLHQASGGNPFYLEALARVPEVQLPTSAVAESRSGALLTAQSRSAVLSLDDVPAVVRASLQAELAMLPERVRLVAHASAVAGDPFEPDLVAAVAGLSRQGADLALDELVARDLVHPAGPGRFSYRHPIVRAAAYEDAGAGWLVRAHARAWNALEERAASVVRCAPHVEHAALSGNDKAIAVLVAAAKAVAGRAPADAAHWLSVALRLLPDEGEGDVRRLELLTDMATFLGISGQLWQARDVLHEVLRLLPRTAADRRVRAVSFCAALEHLLGRHAEASALLLTELRGLPQLEDGGATALQLGLAEASLRRGDVAGARTWAGTAHMLANRHEDRAARATAASFAAYADYLAADIPAALKHCDHAALLVDGLTDGELAQRLDSVAWLGWAEHDLERYDAAGRHLERGLALARATGQNYLLTTLLVSRGSVLLWQGLLTQAEDCFADAEEAALLVRSQWLHAFALAMRCRVAALTREPDQALRLGQQACRLAGPPADWLSLWTAKLLAHAHLMTGDPDECSSILDIAGSDPELSTVDPARRPAWFEFLTTAALALDRAAEGEQWATRAEAAATSLVALPGRRAFARLARARVLYASSDPAHASTTARTAAAEFTKSGNPLDAGRAWLVAGTATAAAGERPRALEDLEQARALFAHCGASGLQERASRELRRLGRRVPRGVTGQRNPRDAIGPAALTSREREVAELLVTGMTSRQIAAKLYLSPRTIDHHVEHITAKLGVTSRTGVASALAMVGGDVGSVPDVSHSCRQAR
ncbi:DNA-binding NarL/FixJ family response regulator [Kibdelosporangium banguiense]|uniref:DNA-binding NarL/FixJ family response regulator n=1 Tax=Kibdelosporangium banguiense TaxID=1365924 RepID=A0ABS4TXJ2_9PSEU|nr:LuxR family transcriptional regulator [Kibdelosporangium banguiense]MBP2329115.1 DNA-binding NarL/FixJ family response regulator [Kibdelosporangium banguiense]